MTTLDPRRLGDALRAGACGIHPREAGTGLLIDCGSWLHRTDFTSSWPPASPAEPQSASTTPCPGLTAETRASSSELSPMPPGFQIHIKKRTNDT